MTNPSPAYTVDIATLAGSATVSDVQVQTLQYSKGLNAAGAASFVLPMRQTGITQANIMPVAHQVTISRAGTAVWGGDITSARADVDRQLVTFTAEGYFGRLHRRLITDDLYYKGVEQENIAWNLIDYTNGVEDTGITRGSHATTVNRSRHWCCWQGTDIAQAIQDLADADDGFDFDITPAKVFNCYSPQRGSAINKTFSTADNVYSVTLDIDGSDIYNWVADIPPSEICTDIQVVTDSTSDTAYGLLQEALNLTHLKDGTDRLHEMREELRIRKRPHTTVQLTTPDVPFISTAYDVGDNVKFTSAIGYCTYSAVTFRVMAYTINVASDGEMATLSLDRYHHLS